MSIYSPADRYIDFLKATLHLETDEQVAGYLSVSRKTISSWRTRGKIPARVQLEFQKPAAQMGLQIGENESVNSKVLETVALGIFLFLRDKYRDTIGTHDRDTAYAFWASEYPRIRRMIIDHFEGLDLTSQDALNIIGDHLPMIEREELFNRHKVVPYDRKKDLSP
jgi:hypothetical protein